MCFIAVSDCLHFLRPFPTLSSCCSSFPRPSCSAEHRFLDGVRGPTLGPTLGPHSRAHSRAYLIAGLKSAASWKKMCIIGCFLRVPSVYFMCVRSGLCIFLVNNLHSYILQHQICTIPFAVSPSTGLYVSQLWFTINNFEKYFYQKSIDSLIERIINNLAKYRPMYVIYRIITKGSFPHISLPIVF